MAHHSCQGCESQPVAMGLPVTTGALPAHQCYCCISVLLAIDIYSVDHGGSGSGRLMAWATSALSHAVKKRFAIQLYWCGPAVSRPMLFACQLSNEQH